MNLEIRLNKYPLLLNLYKRALVQYEKFTVVFLTLAVNKLKKRLSGDNRKTFLFYPQKPELAHTLSHICIFNDYRLTTNIKNAKDADFIIFFKDTTYRNPDSHLTKLSNKHKIINFNSRDISKSTVDKAHKKVFGYGLSINPLSHKGLYVKKGEINALHNAKILNNPEKPQKGFVYQLLVDNIVNDRVEEFRLPVINNSIPFVYVNHRIISERFGSLEDIDCLFNETNNVLKTSDVISSDEYKKIIDLAKEMGVDYAELDVIRDKNTKKLYVADVNNTPACIAVGLSRKDYNFSIQKMSEAFTNSFLSTSKKLESMKIFWTFTYFELALNLS